MPKAELELQLILNSLSNHGVLLYSLPKVVRAAFVKFATAQLESGDIDPAYPLLKVALASETHERRLWKIMVYVAYYHFSSASSIWSNFPNPTYFDSTDQHFFEYAKYYATGVERRGFRGNLNAIDHLKNLVRTVTDTWGSFEAWLTHCCNRPDNQRWAEIQRTMETVKFNGAWASYKIADIISHLYPDLNIHAQDIGVGGGSSTSGPVPGLALLAGVSVKQAAQDIGLQGVFYKTCVEKWGIPFEGMEQLETCLCDFNSLSKGTYYMGHDIDQQMTALKSCGADLWNARQNSFPTRYLGELKGWVGVRKVLKPLYAEWGLMCL